MSKINYVLAKDEDFVKNNLGNFTYIGKEPYVEIPHFIHGERITRYSDMFSRKGKIRGIKSTNKNILSTRNMFCLCKNKNKVLDLSEFDMTGVDNAATMFYNASFKDIIWPKDKMPSSLEFMNRIFAGFTTERLDLSSFDLSNIIDSSDFLIMLTANEVIFPAENLKHMLMTYDAISQDPLKLIDAKFHTEELCWAAVLINKENAKYVRVKSKRILMYLGDECPEYVKFYYNKEN